MALDAAAQVEQQARRCRVGPLQVIHNDEQGVLYCQAAKHVGILLENQALLQATGPRTLLRCQDLQLFQPVRLAGRGGSRAGQELLAWQKDVDQLRSPVHQHPGGNG